MTRYTYAFGYKSRDAAEAALEDMFAIGDVSPGERPKIYRYSCPGGHRWAIDMEGPQGTDMAREDKGHAAYNEDVARKPRYHDGTARPDWHELGAMEQLSWIKNPTPRDWT